MASQNVTQCNFPVDVLKCCCCSSLFDEGIRQPRLLPCLHSVCFHCLQLNIKSKAKIGCKYCQEETDVNDKTVEQFPTNGTQDGFVKLYKIKNSEHFLQCQECEDEPTAEFLCETCPKQLCKDCHEHHKRAKRSHVSYSLQDMPLTFDSAKKLSSARKCQMKGHDGKKLTFYCNSCKQIVCSKCILIAHKEGHTVLELHKTYETEVQKIEKETKTLDVIENKMNNIIELVESEIVNVEETSDRISTEIKTAFEKVIETLNCRKQELMNELRHNTKIKTRRLKDQAFHLKKQISIISSTQSSIKLALSTSDSVSLIDAAPFIIEKTLSLRDIQIDKEPCEKPTLAFVETPLGHDSLLGKFISVSISGSRSQVIVPDVGVVGEETEIKVNLFDDDGNVVNDEEMDVCLKISDSNNTVVHTISCYLTENKTWLGKNTFNTDGRYEIVVVVLGVKLEMATTTIDIENAPVMASAQVEVNTQDSPLYFDSIDAIKLHFFFNEEINTLTSFSNVKLKLPENPEEDNYFILIHYPQNRKEHFIKEGKRLQKLIDGLFKKEIECKNKDRMMIAIDRFKKERNLAVLMQPDWEKNKIPIFSKDDFFIFLYLFQSLYVDGEEAIKLNFFFNEEINNLVSYPNVKLKLPENPEEQDHFIWIHYPPSRKEHFQKENKRLEKLIKGLFKKEIECKNKDRMKIAVEQFKKEKSTVVLMKPDWEKRKILIFSKDDKRLGEAEKFLLEVLDEKDGSSQNSLTSSHVGRNLADSTHAQSQYDRQASDENASSNSTKQTVSSRPGRKLETSVKQSSRHNWSDPNEDDEDSVTSHNTRFMGKKFEFFTKEGLIVKLYRGSITKLNVDAIVNAANEHLRNISGVAQAISNAAGKALEDGCSEHIRKRKMIHVSENCVTISGNLPCSFVIHAVGPNWHDYRDKKKCLIDLCDTVVNVLKTSQERRFKVVVMPPISSGIFSVPQRLCAAMYLKAITDFSQKFTGKRQVEEFHIIDIKDEMLNLIQDVFKKWKKDPSCVDPEKLVQGYSSKGSKSYQTSDLSENKWGGLRMCPDNSEGSRPY